MVIDRVRLANIKSYAAAAISFRSGVNFIKGANGTGKTTLIEAVGFALFNVTATGFAGGIHSYLLREGEKEGEVCVTFSANGYSYEVLRTVSKEASRRKWTISCDGEAVAGLMTDRDKVAFLQDAMGLPPEQKTDKLFTDMIGVRQGQFKAPFEYARRSRIEYFNEIFGVADFNRARENMNALKKSIQGKRSELKTLSAALAGTVNQLEPKKKELEDLSVTMAKMQEALFLLSKQKKKAQEVYDLTSELEMLEKKIVLLQENGETRIREAQKTIEKIKEELLELQKEETAAVQAEEEAGKNRLALEAVKAALAAIRKDAAGVSEYLRGTAEKIAYERESVIKSLEEAKAEARKLENGLCPYFGETCEKMQGKQFLSRVTPLEKRLEETEERFLKVLKRPKNMQWDAHIRAYEDAVRGLEAEFHVAGMPPDKATAFLAYCNAEEEIQTLFSALKELERDIRTESEVFLGHTDLLFEQAGKRERALAAKSAAAQKAAESAKRTLGEAEKRLAAVQTEISAARAGEVRRDEIKKMLGGTTVDAQSAQKELLRLSGEAGRAEEQIRLSKKTMDSLARDIEEMEETRRQIEEYGAKEKEFSRAASEAELLADLLRQAGGRVAEMYTRKISAFAARMYAQVAEDGAVLRFDTEYDAQLTDIYKGKTRVRSFNQLSGGQRMIAALCVRIAMLTSFAGLPIAFFDEPTENMDAEKKQNLAQNLRSNLGGFTQIFIISHDDAFDRLTENVIYLEETREGTVSAAL
jgi:exonuclease SbcC